VTQVKNLLAKILKSLHLKKFWSAWDSV